MSDPARHDPADSNQDPELQPRVIEIEAAAPAAPPVALMPQLLVTDRSEPVVPSDPQRLPVPERAAGRRRSRAGSIAWAGVGLGLSGWLMVDAAAWVMAAFDAGVLVGGAAALAALSGIGGAGVLIGRELRAFWRLRGVAEIRARLADRSAGGAPAARRAIGQALAVLPRDPETARGLARYGRQAQRHHSTAQQIEIMSQTVMPPLDRRAEAHIRSAVLRAFGITAISPTALTDTLFFLACGLRMVRGIAAAYGHRPGAAATADLLRRLLVEAGRLGGVDIASATLAQHLGGALTERFASTTAEAVYAAYRMARLGVIVMDICRPVPFRPDHVPSLGSLVGNVLKRRNEELRGEPPGLVPP
jgi:putative membrane protein